MMPRMNSVVDSLSSTAPCPADADDAMSRPDPGWMMFPTIRPMTRATVDMTRK